VRGSEGIWNDEKRKAMMWFFVRPRKDRQVVQGFLMSPRKVIVGLGYPCLRGVGEGRESEVETKLAYLRETWNYFFVRMDESFELQIDAAAITAGKHP
jgi:hypothetical protein